MTPRSTRGLIFTLDCGRLALPPGVPSSVKGKLLHDLVVRLESTFPWVQVRIGSAANNNPWSESVQRVRAFVEREWALLCQKRAAA